MVKICLLSSSIRQAFERLKRGVWRWMLVIIAVGWTTGCQNRVNWGPPGTIGQQRARAHVYDPYPNNDLAPPIVGGRPPGFDRPSSEVRRLQQDNPFAKKKAPINPVNPLPMPQANPWGS